MADKLRAVGGSSASLLAGIDLKTASIDQLLSAVKPRVDATVRPVSSANLDGPVSPEDEAAAEDFMSQAQSLSANGGQGDLRTVAKLLADRWQELPADRKQAVFRKQLIQEREFFMKKAEQEEQEKHALAQKIEELEVLHAEDAARQESAFQSELQTLHEKMEVMSQEISKLTHEHEEEIRNIHSRSATISSDKDSENAMLRMEIKSLQEQCQQLTATAHQMEQDYREEHQRMSAEIDVLKREKALLEGETSDLTTRLQDAEAAKAKAPIERKSSMERKTAMGELATSTQRVNDDLGVLKEASEAMQGLLKQFGKQDEKAVKEMENRLKQLELKVKELEEDSSRMTRFILDVEVQLRNGSRLPDAQREELERQLAETRKRLAETESELASKRADWKMQEAQLVQAKAYLEQRTQMMNESMGKLVGQLEALEERCGALAAENADLRAQQIHALASGVHRSFGVNTDITFPDNSELPVDKSVWRRSNSFSGDPESIGAAVVSPRRPTSVAPPVRTKSKSNLNSEDPPRWKF